MTRPGVAVGGPPVPPALPRASTSSRTRTLDELPSRAVGRPFAPGSDSRAMSAVES
ncbi:Uncharacterised protein [Mycobacteroides abscessus subsp. abscessus]|nr:Uncharacterised protein [Mycobacteroides abscessus subsp. abscessus]